MKVLHINCSDGGSTGKIISDIASVIKNNGWESVLCTPRITVNSEFKKYSFCSKNEQRIYSFVSRLTGHRFSFAPFSTQRILHIIKKEKPNLVHIHCINNNTVSIGRLFSYLKKHKHPTVITNHAEFFYTGSCDHANDCTQWINGCVRCPQGYKECTWNWNYMKTSFKGFENLVMTSVSPWVMSRAKESGITALIPQVLIENGVNTDVFHPYDDVSDLRGEIPENYKIIFCAMSFFYGNSEKKGSKYLIDLANRFLEDPVVFMIAGRHSSEIQVPRNVILLGNISDQRTLAKYYSMADLCLSTGKRETFGMSIAESLCCGTPIIGFFAGGPESIALPDETEFCDFGDVDSLENMIRDKWLNYKISADCNEISLKSKDKYDKVLMAGKFLELYNRMVLE